MENETKYTIETYDKKEANLMLNATRMASVLYDFMNWHKDIYNGKTSDYRVLYDGKLYSYDEWYIDNAKVIVEDDDKNGNGIIKSSTVRYIYTEEDIENKLEDLLSEIQDLIYNYYE